MVGKFVTFEGGEGVGKSTQAQLLAERLAGEGITPVVTREPGGTALAEQLRVLLMDGPQDRCAGLAEALIFFAARADHLERLIRPSLARGDWVICDRFSDSTRVYQGAAGDVDDAVIKQLEEIVVGATVPDLTVILDLDPAIGLARADERRQQAAGANAVGPSDRFEGRDIAFHRGLRDGFLALAKREPKRCHVINANRNIEDIAKDVWSVVAAQLLGGK